MDTDLEAEGADGAALKRTNEHSAAYELCFVSFCWMIFLSAAEADDQ